MGGCLIQSLPVALIESAHYSSVTEQDVYRTAFEADMNNLLIGTLAEAKHVALRDNEQFNAYLVNINALHYYGGTSDLEKIYEIWMSSLLLKASMKKRCPSSLTKVSIYKLACSLGSN